MTVPGAVRTIRVWADTVTRGQVPCRFRTCRAPMWFAQSVGRGRMVPFNGPKTPHQITEELGTGRIMWHMDERQLHFITCPGSKGKARPPAGTPRKEWQDD